MLIGPLKTNNGDNIKDNKSRGKKNGFLITTAAITYTKQLVHILEMSAYQVNMIVNEMHAIQVKRNTLSKIKKRGSHSLGINND